MRCTVIYLLDTNTCIQYLTGRSSQVIAKFKTIASQNITLCDVVKSELYYGAYKSFCRAENLNLYELFFSQYISFPFDGNAASSYGQIRFNLEAKGTPIDAYDLQIAAIALAHNLILVSHNIK